MSLYECPLGGACETSGIIYQCKVEETHSGNSKSYIGLSERTFKDRYTKWRSAFRNEGYHKNSLSKHVWFLKRNHIDFVLSWQIVSKARSYSPATKICELCTREVYFIMFHKEKASLNKRNEFFNFCPHRGKFLICNQWIVINPTSHQCWIKISENSETNVVFFLEYSAVLCLLHFFNILLVISEQSTLQQNIHFIFIPK